MSDSREWPGDWHGVELEPTEPGFTNDHGILYMVGDSAGEYISYRSDGFDPMTENRR